MKLAFCVALLLILNIGCNRASLATTSVATDSLPASSVAASSFKVNPEDDRSVISAALDHFAKQKVSGNASAEGIKKIIVIDSNSQGPSAYLWRDPLDGEFKNEDEKGFNDLSMELRIRNRQTASVVDLVRGENLVVDDLSKLPEGMEFIDAFEKKHPQAIRYIGLWLPAFSDDGSRAMLRFSFGPTAHGATAIYLLIKKNGIWKVKLHEIAYYL